MTVPLVSTPSGILEKAFHNLVSRRAVVQRVQAIGPRFRIVTLAGEELANRSWTPGDMVQIAFANWEARAYTPYAFDPRTGSATFLGYVHGNGVGSQWLASTTAGEERFLVGPRSALNLDPVRRPAIFFGDETSFSTAAAMHATTDGVRGVTFVFEVDAIEASRAALAEIGLSDVTLLRRQEGDLHLDDAERVLRAVFEANADAKGVLTGKASSIKRLYKSARSAGIGGRAITNVAYWAPGRKGFSGVQR